MNYIIGVDAGGTKTEAIAYSLKGDELTRADTGYGNMVLNKAAALNNIVKAIEICMNNLESKKPMAIYLGIAGVEAGDNKTLVEKAIKEKIDTNIMVLNDAEIALEALLEGEDGILTIGGTGSISLGRYKGKRASAGGWGHLLGDGGSGYFVSIEAFKNMIMEEECNIIKSKMSKKILEELSLNNVQEIKGFIYSSTKAEIASFTPLIVQMANNGERNAIEILKRAGIELAVNTERLYNRLNFKGTVKVALKGSVVTKIEIVREEFEKYLRNVIDDLIILDEDISSAKGAYYLAIKDLNTNA